MLRESTIEKLYAKRLRVLVSTWQGRRWKPRKSPSFSASAASN